MSNALQTLYAAPGHSATALAGNVGGQEREQECWTPDLLTNVCRVAMGGIQLDPCGASRFDSNVTLKATKNRPQRVNPITGGWFADVTLVKPGTFEGLVKSPHGGTAICLDGKEQDWSQAESTFVNPPFDDLEAWMRLAAQHGQKSKVCLLGPFRPHRRWFTEIAKTCTDFVTLWYSVRFKGHQDACPFPLFLASWSCEIPDMGTMETGRVTFR